eukprot:7081842-Pyramimonas_sp.AAC.1
MGPSWSEQRHVGCPLRLHLECVEVERVVCAWQHWLAGRRARRYEEKEGRRVWEEREGGGEERREGGRERDGG